MTDESIYTLITELREHQRDYPSLIHAELCGRAADEIERLLAAAPSIPIIPVDEAKKWQEIAGQGVQIEHELRIEIERLRAQLAAMRAALEPFAHWIEQRDDKHSTKGYPDACPLAYYPQGVNEGAATVGDLRRARTVLSDGRKG